MGWCVDRAWLVGLHARCCEMGTERRSHPGICLVAGSGEGRGCVTGPDLGLVSQAKPRCVDEGGCRGGGETCVRPSREDSVVRIAVKRRSGREEPRVVIFQGHRRRLFAQGASWCLEARTFADTIGMQSKYRPFRQSTGSCLSASPRSSRRASGRSLPPFRISDSRLKLDDRLVVSVCLALMFLNLLPVGMLDGSAIIDSFLSCLFSLDPGGLLDSDALENGLSTIGHSRPLHHHHRRDRLAASTDVLGRFVGMVRGKVRPRSQEAVAGRHLRWRNVSKNVQRLSTALAGFVFVSAFVVELID